MTHLVAVSGANLAIFLAAILLAARWTRIGPAAAAAWCSVALVGFVVLVRPSPSVLRAACMGGIALLGLAVGRPRATLPALTATIGILLLDEPALATQVGFALSAAATAGLLLIGPHLTRLLRRWRVPAAPAEALAVATAAQLACAPVIAGLSGTVSLVAVPANLLAEPAVPPATLLGLGAALLHPLWPGGAAFLAWLAAWPTRWLILVAARGAALPGAVLSWPSGVAGAVLLGVVTLVGVLVLRRRAIRVAAVTCLASLWCGWCGVQLVAASTWPPAHPLLVACDVGQGDALVLPTGPAAAVVVDTGPIPGPTDQCLAELRVRTVPLLLLTHFHADHVGGIAGVYGHGRAVGEVLTSPYREPIPGYQAVLAVAAAHATPVVVPPLGWTTAIGSIALQVLGPPNLIQGTTSDPNNNSLVVMVREGGYRLLLAGDAQVEEQAAILARAGPGAVRADVLKVAHHGSAYQDLAFLAAVAPVLALVSVGAGNPYGHPSLAVLADLRRAGARVLRTDTDGEIAAVLDHGQLAAQARGLPPGQHPP
jgi:competence protein ComEC